MKVFPFNYWKDGVHLFNVRSINTRSNGKDSGYIFFRFHQRVIFVVVQFFFIFIVEHLKQNSNNFIAI